jgi:hypothetical protein
MDKARLAMLDELQVQGVLLVHLLASRNPKWLAGCEPVIQALLKQWESRTRQARLAREESLPLVQLSEAKLLMQCLLHCVRLDRCRTDVIWALLGGFSNRSLADNTFFR